MQVYCKSCRAAIDHERYERRVGRTLPRRSFTVRDVGRDAWLRSLKVGKRCTDCGKAFPPQVMQWDHLPGFEKLGEISEFSGHTRAELVAEIAKCELVCTNCHILRTVSRNGWIDWSETQCVTASSLH